MLRVLKLRNFVPLSEQAGTGPSFENQAKDTIVGILSNSQCGKIPGKIRIRPGNHFSPHRTQKRTF